MTDPLSPPPPQSVQRPTGRALRWGLLASLALNVMLLALIGGAALRQSREVAQPTLIRGDVLRQLYHALPEEDRQVVRRGLVAQSGSFRSTGRAFIRANREIRAALTAEPFEIAALEAALAKHRALLLQLSDKGQTVILTHIRTLSAEDRAALAQAMRAKRPKGPRGPGGGGRPRAPGANGTEGGARPQE